MYAAFRENNESLPGDEELLKKPSIKIYLYPLPSDPVDQVLPKLASCQLIVQKNMTIDALKKYLLKKFEMVEDTENINIFFKNMIMKNEFSLNNIEILYQFPTDRIVFYYSRNKFN
jgi:hypothetical protein